jgi:uncharacterized protein (DUF1697 family)
MGELRELFGDLGYTDVRTVLASGNVIFTGPKAGARAKLERAIEERFAMKVDVVVKTMDELRAIVDADPYGARIDHPTRYFVVFLDGAPDTTKREALAREDFEPDSFTAGRHELYVWCPEGMQSSKLMKALGKPGLAGTATVRNWATVNKLLD